MQAESRISAEGMIIRDVDRSNFFQINIYICLFNVESSVVYLFNLGR